MAGCSARTQHLGIRMIRMLLLPESGPSWFASVTECGRRILLCDKGHVDIACWVNPVLDAGRSFLSLRPLS